MASVARTLTHASKQVSFTLTPLRRHLTTAARARPTTSIAAPIRQTRRRGYASGGSTSGGSSKIVIPLGLGLIGAAGYYAYSNDLLASAFGAQASGLKTGGVITPTKDDFQKVYNDVAELLDNNDYDDGSYGPVCILIAAPLIFNVLTDYDVAKR